MTRILVTGSRSLECRALADAVLARLTARYGTDLVIVHGGAGGVDQVFDEAAKARDITVEAHPAAWDVHGKKAGPIRTSEMVAAGADLCIAVHPELMASKGTRDCVHKALLAGIPVWHIADVHSADPVWIRRLTLDDMRYRSELFEKFGKDEGPAR